MLAIKKLETLGYQVHLQGETINLSYKSQGDPDPVLVKPLLEELKSSKAEAIRYLQKQQVAHLLVEQRSYFTGKLAVKLFPYPLPTHLLMNGIDPIDLKRVGDQIVHLPEWWRRT